ncbi:MAG: M20/M25/M40 family metallo-hydrolase, partial [Candidatus Neomarinimicrobiota bacterium]
SCVLGILEAVEYLLQQNFQPERTVLLAFGHDEEIGGSRGAAKIAALLEQRNIRAVLVLDEGGLIVLEGVPGITAPVALVGVAEKGYLSLELTVHSNPGHSSMPPPETAINILSQAIVALQEQPLPATLDGPLREMLVTIAPETGLPYNLLFSNLWAFGPIIKSQLAASPKSAALIRTTTAATMFNSGIKDNVLPTTAQAVVNFRLKPGDSIAEVVDYVRRAIDDPRVEISVIPGADQEASSVSDHRSDQFVVLAKSIRQIYPDALVSPYISVGGTDAKHYDRVSDNIFRFLPLKMNNEQLDSMHGNDEAISADSYLRLIAFYSQIIRNSAGGL